MSKGDERMNRGGPAFFHKRMNQSRRLVKAGSDEGARPLNLASTKMKTGVENSRGFVAHSLFDLNGVRELLPVGWNFFLAAEKKVEIKEETVSRD